MGHREVVDKVPLHIIVVEVAFDLYSFFLLILRNIHITLLLALAGSYHSLHAHLMTEQAEERLKLRDGPGSIAEGDLPFKQRIVRLGS